MIIIDDNDLPIAAAAKIIQGTRPYMGSYKTLGEALDLVRKDESGQAVIDQFEISELREIATYLNLFCDFHKEDY